MVCSKNSFWINATLVGCGGLERSNFGQFQLLRGCGGLDQTHFQHFLCWEDMVVLKKVIFVSFHIGSIWLYWKDCFGQFSLWEGTVVLRALMLDNVHFGRWGCWIEWFWIIVTLGGCASHETTDFGYLLHWEGMVVLKGLVFVSFHSGRML